MCIKLAKTGFVVSALASLLLLGFPSTGRAQVQHWACYIPEVGAVYRIREVGLPAGCVDPTHVEFSWGVTEHGLLTGLTDDDHPQYLLADGVRATTNGFVVEGAIAVGAIPATGSGVRLMWYPGKAAFRAGAVQGGYWDEQQVGYRSTATGTNTIASGETSTALGGWTVASGGYSTAMGSNTTASGNYATAMGSYTVASGEGSTAMGNNASTNGHAGTFVYGDKPLYQYIDWPDVQATADNQFMVRAVGGTVFYSDPLLTAGVSLAPGAGAWATISDVNRKSHFRDVDGERVLQLIEHMPIREWSYRAQSPSIRHLGPTAQDFYAAFGLGGSDTTITTTDIDGVNLLAVQALVRRTQEQAQEIDELRAEVAALQAAIEQRR